MKKITVSLIVVCLMFAPLAYAASSFKDVKPGTWYYDYVMKASEMGIIDGFKDGTFKPGDTVTRAQLAKVIVEYDENLKTRTQDEDKTINAIAGAMPSVVKVASNFGQGSGFFIRPNIILTNEHVVGDLAPVDVVLSTGQWVQGTVIHKDASKDIAIVQVKGNYNHLSFANKLLVGQTAIALGNPLSKDFSASKGIVSKLNIYGDYNMSNMFQTDAPINSGNSGGPVVDNNGNVIGMVTGKLADTFDTIEGMAYAIDHVELEKFLKQHGK